MAVQIQLRRGTAAAWTSANPTLADGEIGVESDTDLFKIGDGLTAWTNLSYGGIQGTAGTNGTNGTNGQGVPLGGTVNQVLRKNSSTDYDTSWFSAHEDDQTILSSQVFS
jgi:hypothetical protein